MSDGRLKITLVKDSGDGRGRSFPIPAECFTEGFPVQDAHLSTLLPGYVRGDHYHAARHEILLVMSADCWSLYWDSGAGTQVENRTFDGSSAVVLQVPLNASHAIRNDGDVPLQILGLSDGTYDPAVPDAYTRKVTPEGSDTRR